MLKRLFKHLIWRVRMARRIYVPQLWYSCFLPGRVQSGPFTGMLYGRFSTGSVVLPKLLGTYESELHPILSKLSLSEYAHCLDVGAGEGYYAVGLCFRHPHLQMKAFETERKGQRQIRNLARKNGLQGRIAVLGHCGPEDLAAALPPGKRCLLIMDVEGYEEILLDPVRIPALTAVDFIVEVHPEKNERLKSVLMDRFAASHHLEIVQQQAIRALPPGVRVPAWLRRHADYLVQEFRGPQFWLAGRVKSMGIQ